MENSTFSEQFIIMFCGLPGAGKTTLSKKLLKVNNFAFFSIRDARRFLKHKDYQPEENHTIFKYLYLNIERSMKKKEKIVFDSNATMTIRRQEIINLANYYSYGTIIIECTCEEKESKNRIKNRFVTKDGLFDDTNDPSVYDLLKHRWVNIGEAELRQVNVSYLVFDSQKSVLKFIKVKRDSKENIFNLFKKIEGIQILKN